MPRSDQEAFYRLDVKDQILLISIHPDAWEYVVNIMGSTSRDLAAMADFLEEKWIPPQKLFPSTFGFGAQNQFQIEKNSDWVLCKTVFPQAESTSACASALHALFSRLWLYGFDCKKIASQNKDAPLTNPQLLIVNGMAYQGGFGELGLNITIQPALAEWVTAHTKENPGRWTHTEISQAMQDIAIYMRGSEYFDRFPYSLSECNCTFSDYNGVYFNCYGDACDLGAGGNNNLGGSYTLGPHNCDSFDQQFVLFAGVAKLCEVARRELAKK